MWFVYSLISGVFYTGSGLLTRYVLKNKKDAWAFSFYFSAIGTLVSLPFMLTNPKMATSWQPWLLMLLVGLLIVLQNFLNFTSSNYLEASLNGTVTKLRLAWIFILGILFLHETFSLNKILGTILILVASFIIIKKFSLPNKLKGIYLAIASTFAYATVILFYKFLFSSFNSFTLTFFIFLIPATLNLLFMPKSFSRIYKIFREDGKPVLIACALGAFANLAMNSALSIGEISKVPVIIESFLIITLVGEHLFLKEKQHLLTKIIAVALALTGALLIKLS